MKDLIQHLRNTPNWQREAYADWKTGTAVYDRAPFEAADALERLTAGDVEFKVLRDSQWVNIVNSRNVLDKYDPEEAVREAIKLAEIAFKENAIDYGNRRAAAAVLAERSQGSDYEQSIINAIRKGTP
jgi:hypothetical protein